jgi:signal peptidase I
LPEGARLPVDWLDAAVELLARSGTRGTMIVRGTSMEPTLSPGAVIEVDFSRSSLQPGDLLVFRQAEFIVVHRLVHARRGGMLRTQGDGCPDPDPPVARESVLGRVTAFERSPGVRLSLDGASARRHARRIARGLRVSAFVIRCASITDTLLGKIGIRPGLRTRLTTAQRAALRLTQP